MGKWDRITTIKEAATEIRDVDFSHKGISEKGANFEINDDIEHMKEEILDLAWYIPSGAVSRATETVISLLVEEAFKGD